MVPFKCNGCWLNSSVFRASLIPGHITFLCHSIPRKFVYPVAEFIHQMHNSPSAVPLPVFLFIITETKKCKTHLSVLKKFILVDCSSIHRKITLQTAITLFYRLNLRLRIRIYLFSIFYILVNNVIRNDCTNKKIALFYI